MSLLQSFLAYCDFLKFFEVCACIRDGEGGGEGWFRYKIQKKIQICSHIYTSTNYHKYIF